MRGEADRIRVGPCHSVFQRRRGWGTLAGTREDACSGPAAGLAMLTGEEARGGVMGFSLGSHAAVVRVLGPFARPGAAPAEEVGAPRPPAVRASQAPSAACSPAKWRGRAAGAGVGVVTLGCTGAVALSLPAALSPLGIPGCPQGDSPWDSPLSTGLPVGRSHRVPDMSDGRQGPPCPHRRRRRTGARSLLLSHATAHACANAAHSRLSRSLRPRGAAVLCVCVCSFPNTPGACCGAAPPGLEAGGGAALKGWGPTPRPGARRPRTGRATPLPAG